MQKYKHELNYIIHDLLGVKREFEGSEFMRTNEDAGFASISRDWEWLENWMSRMLWRNCCNQKEDIKTPNVDSTSLLKEQGSFCLPSSELGANTMADVVPLSLVWVKLIRGAWFPTWWVIFTCLLPSSVNISLNWRTYLTIA